MPNSNQFNYNQEQQYNQDIPYGMNDSKLNYTPKPISERDSTKPPSVGGSTPN